MTVETTGKRRSYHHGNLRPALIEATIELIDEQGIRALTLRELARRVGVTHAAPYRHFRDKSALLRAVAAHGFRQLAARLRETTRDPQGAPRSGAQLLGRIANSYLDFAGERPALYRLMYASDPDDPAAAAATDEPQATVIRELERAVRDLRTPTDAGPDDTRVLALVLWAQLHGLASLWAHQQLPTSNDPTATPRSALIEAAVRLTQAGLTAVSARSS
jgi:AcrR family transcriptional regulator